MNLNINIIKKAIINICNILRIKTSLIRLYILSVKLFFYKKLHGINNPIIHLYAVCWNEAAITPLFLKYYNKFIDKYHIYDNGSNDGTLELIKNDIIEIIHFETNGNIDDERYLEIKNNVWKRSRGKADWVIVCDFDELIYTTEDIKKHLKKTKATIFKPTGYNMYSKTFPVKGLIEDVKNGVKDVAYDKMILFNPHKIIETNYFPGCHTANPTGIVKIDNSSLSLLHYKNLGINYVLQKVRAYKKRNELNYTKGYGIHYHYEEEKIINDFHQNLNNSQRII